MDELPFMATENIIMAGVMRGGDRQELHEAVRGHSHAAAAQVKNGGTNDLLDRLAGDPVINMTRAEIDAVLDLREFVGRAPQQVEEFLAEEVDPVLERNRQRLGGKSDVRV
jgi:adenylosuccinate lyase